MGIVTCKQEIEDIYGAFECFKERFLKSKQSIFSDKKVFTRENLNILIDGFVDSPDESDNSFDEKIKKQLGDDKGAHELFAHIIWLWSLAASDMKEDSKKIDVNKWLSDENKVTEDSQFFFDHGVMNTGQYHKTNKPAELIFIIKFLEKFLSENENFNYVEIIKNGVCAGTEKQEVKVGDKIKKVAMYNILLHLFDPNNFFNICSYGHKEKIISFFSDYFSLTGIDKNDDLDDRFKIVWDKCKAKFGAKYPYEWNQIYNNKEFNTLDFYNKKLESYWKSDIVLESKNMILHGAPGTGKTYSVENSIKSRLEFGVNTDAGKQYTLVQFHPSYGYEDFIDGIKPLGITENGNMEFGLVNGSFKNMCITAFKELKRFDDLTPTEQKKQGGSAKNFYFVADEVNRAELSRVFGELLLCLEDGKRLKVKGGEIIGTMLKTQNSNLWKERHAVVAKDGEYYFGVPENLYFIGTMNDIDRSVDSFDMALRRRFFWKHYKCDYDVIQEKFLSGLGNDKIEKIDKYIESCKRLNKTISGSGSTDFNLGESYELGHSYFMYPNDINKVQIEKMWVNHLEPLLREYLRAEHSEKEIKDKIKSVKKDFITKLQ